MNLQELCEKYKLEVEEIDTNTYKVNNDTEVNLDQLMSDIGECSIMFDGEITHKKIGICSYKIGRLYAFTTEPRFKKLGMDYKHKLMDSGLNIYTERNYTSNTSIIW